MSEQHQELALWSDKLQATIKITMINRVLDSITNSIRLPQPTIRIQIV